MPIPDTQELEDTVLDILKRARKNGQLSDLTPRMVREEMEKRFSLSEDALGTKKYKSFIKDAIRATLDKLEEEDGEDEVEESDKETQPKSSKKRKPSHSEVAKAKGPPPKEAEGTNKADKRKRKSVCTRVLLSGSDSNAPAQKAVVELSDEEPEVGEDEASESEAPPPNKPSARSKPPKGKLDKAAKPRKTPKKPESHKAYKSVATIETSDEDVPEEQPAPSRSSEQGQKSMKSSPPKKQMPSSKSKNSTKEKEESDAEMSTRDLAGPSSSKNQPKPKSPAKSPKSPSKKKKDVLPKDPMESELSSVIDEPPKKRRKKQEKDSAKPQKAEKAKRVKKTKEPPSKDEETVNRLKVDSSCTIVLRANRAVPQSIVAACGVRKVWKKEFEGLDKPSQQIKRLHEILHSLGMSSRYSLEKAKTIREQRELAQELKDVQEFEKATRRRDGGRVKDSDSAGEPGEQSDSDAEMPTQKRTSARAIRTFLESQSDEE
ncbi:hypothetical protein BDN67DRAFT_1070374 [Paxillus ammoniavirescens]|nr:hypothetical protein BDN67DRAFT_1070374 [Paxillus ammoniavirescens]